jgi:hypothetical protein
LLVSGCRPRSLSNEIVVNYDITPKPVRVGLARITLNLADASGAPINGANVKLEGNMAHPGMGPVFGDATQIGPGEYAGALEFTMPGDWALGIHASLPGGGKLERQISVKGVEAR